MAPTRLNERQLPLRDVFSVARVLAARGFEVTRTQALTDTLMSAENPTEQEIDVLFNTFDDQKVRFELSNCINGKAHSVGRISQFLSLPGIILEQSRFTKTLEWYFGELLVRRFHAFSAAFGVELAQNPNPRNGQESGDYDVLAVMGDSNLVYMECKSGGTDHEQIIKATDRGNSVFAVATIITLSHKTTIDLLRAQLAYKSYPGISSKLDVATLRLKGSKDSTVYAWHNTFFLPRSGATAEAGLRTILRLIALNRVELLKGFGVDDNDYDRLGFDLNPSS